jgi:hypothetical protein
MLPAQKKPLEETSALAATGHEQAPRGTYRPVYGPRCPVCGDVFIRFVTNRLYCSRRCQKRSQTTRKQRQFI